MADVFEQIISSGFEPKMVAVALTGLKTEVEREEKKELGTERVKDIFEVLRGKHVDKILLKKMFSEALRQPEKPLSFQSGVGESEIRKTILGVLQKNPGIAAGQNPESALMGLVMRELRGKAGGAAVMQVVKEILKK